MIAEPIIPPAIAQAKGLKNILVKSSGRNPPIVVAEVGDEGLVALASNVPTKVRVKVVGYIRR